MVGFHAGGNLQPHSSKFWRSLGVARINFSSPDGKFLPSLSVCDSLASDKAPATANHLHQLLSEGHCSSLIGFSDIYPSIDAIKTDFSGPRAHLNKRITDKEISFRLGWEWKRLRSIPAGLQWDHNVNLLFDSCKSKWKNPSGPSVLLAFVVSSFCFSIWWIFM